MRFRDSRLEEAKNGTVLDKCFHIWHVTKGEHERVRERRERENDLFIELFKRGNE